MVLGAGRWTLRREWSRFDPLIRIYFVFLFINRSVLHVDAAVGNWLCVNNEIRWRKKIIFHTNTCKTWHYWLRRRLCSQLFYGPPSHLITVKFMLRHAWTASLAAPSPSARDECSPAAAYDVRVCIWASPKTSAKTTEKRPASHARGVKASSYCAGVSDKNRYTGVMRLW